MIDNDFDAIVVGAGIGGLVCANYLAKDGMRVLVVEKNSQPGGYCTSFQRRDFLFDSVIHAIQNCDQGNVLYKIFQELEISEEIRTFRCNPTDTVIAGCHRIHIMNDVSETIDNFRKAYPDQGIGISKFFKLILDNDFVYLYTKYRKLTFFDILNGYFSNQELKSIFGLFLGNIGSIPSNTCALTAFALLKQFILSGGYYPIGGIQTIPDALARKIRQNRGVLMLSSKVKEIVVRDGCVCGVRLDDNRTIYSKIVVSNADLTFTIKGLLKSDPKYAEIVNKIDNADPSYSIYIVYLVLKKQMRDCLDVGPGVWYIPPFKSMENCLKGRLCEAVINPGIFCSIASKLDNSKIPVGYDQLRIMVNTKYREQAFWRENAKGLSEGLIGIAGDVIPGLKNYIICEGRATSVTMRNYTLNRDGAVCGWLNSPKQVNDPITKYLPDINGLYFAGHWITERYGNGGIAMASESGRKIAKLIIKRK